MCVWNDDRRSGTRLCVCVCVCVCVVRARARVREPLLLETTLTEGVLHLEVEHGGDNRVINTHHTVLTVKHAREALVFKQENDDDVRKQNEGVCPSPSRRECRPNVEWKVDETRHGNLVPNRMRYPRRAGRGKTWFKKVHQSISLLAMCAGYVDVFHLRVDQLGDHVEYDYGAKREWGESGARVGRAR